MLTFKAMLNDHATQPDSALRFWWRGIIHLFSFRAVTKRGYPELDEFSTDDAMLLLFHANGKLPGGGTTAVDLISKYASTAVNVLFYGTMIALIFDVFDDRIHWLIWAELIIAFTLMIAITLRKHVTRRKLVPFADAVRHGRLNTGACLNCDYNVTGVDSATCPECGEPIIIETILLNLQRDLIQRLEQSE